MTAGKTRADRSETVCPEDKANFFSKITYWWLNSLIWQGYRNPLEQNNLWLLSKRFQCKPLSDDFETFWAAERERAKNVSPETVKSTQGPSLMKAIWKFMFPKLAPVGILKVLNDITTISSPLLLKEIIKFVSAKDDRPVSQGIVYIVILFILNILTSIFLNAYFQNTTTLGMSLRTAISSQIYRKSLRLSSAARQDFNAGKVMNIVSTDCQRLEMFIMFCHVLVLLFLSSLFSLIK